MSSPFREWRGHDERTPPLSLITTAHASGAGTLLQALAHAEILVLNRGSKPLPIQARGRQTSSSIKRSHEPICNGSPSEIPLPLIYYLLIIRNTSPFILPRLLCRGSASSAFTLAATSMGTSEAWKDDRLGEACDCSASLHSRVILGLRLFNEAFYYPPLYQGTDAEKGTRHRRKG